MKATSNLHAIVIATALAIATLTAGITLAKDAESPEATTKGVISEKSATALIVNGPDFYPISYNISETTQYVDEEGNPVQIEEVKKGAPVIIYSHEVEGQVTASKVVVKKTKLGHTATAPAKEQ